MLIQALRFAMQLYLFFILRGKKSPFGAFSGINIFSKDFADKRFFFSLSPFLFLSLLSFFPPSVLPPSLKDSRV